MFNEFYELIVIALLIDIYHFYHPPKNNKKSTPNPPKPNPTIKKQIKTNIPPKKTSITPTKNKTTTNKPPKTNKTNTPPKQPHQTPFPLNMTSQTKQSCMQSGSLIIQLTALVVVHTYFLAHIHLRFKHAVLGTHTPRLSGPMNCQKVHSIPVPPPPYLLSRSATVFITSQVEQCGGLT